MLKIVKNTSEKLGSIKLPKGVTIHMAAHKEESFDKAVLVVDNCMQRFYDTTMMIDKLGTTLSPFSQCEPLTAEALKVEKGISFDIEDSSNEVFNLWGIYFNEYKEFPVNSFAEGLETLLEHYK